MDRKNRNIQPAPNMNWSEKYSMWVDIDNRTPERKLKDEATMHRAELQHLLDQIKIITEISLEFESTEGYDTVGDKQRMKAIQELVIEAQTHLG